MKTLYISDLDGTLLNNQAELSPYTIETINEFIKKGGHFSVATARTAATVTKILSSLHLNVPVVLMNGVILYDMEKKQYLNTWYLSPETAAFILDTAKRFHLTGFLYEIKENALSTYYERLINQGMTDYYTERTVNFGKTFIQTDDLLTIDRSNIIYYAMLDRKEALLPAYEIYKDTPGIATAFYRDNYCEEELWFLEVFSGYGTKYNAVKTLRENLGYEKVVCFGDNLNDLPMFKASDVSLAVANAKDEVKAAADYVIESNMENGVANWLKNQSEK
ncbi:Cof-type HAD-IIB family hydrolase [Anaerocolumna xylanovorans]|uniref:Cof subfamily of IIB subfamily of haloacid dehalogenase superfamily/HAD-superfamily hydrolase, subfamily IIB n=1 Tax=Anaerocolumna xylanovorans DSM 12503 TaxID=1121345 RepID=A0A1M7Y968_9FIRM|nr:Cof-type HAD-IIB family hydrolase [Anaerocolumna xylanovorans]SHO49185.1 hypothetical protein SAMN02745217_02179 [Anaerocolumna xylanovorans DSM 12503]